MIARVDVAAGTRSANFYLDRKSLAINEEYTYPDFEYIYLKISKETIGEMRIRFNPFMSETFKKVLKHGIIKQYPFINEKQFAESKLLGRIR